MSTPVYNAGNPYAMDDFAFNNTQSQVRNTPNNNPGQLSELEMADAAEAFESKNAIEDLAQQEKENDPKHGLDDIDPDTGNLDEFSKFDSNASQKVSSNYFEEERKRRKRQVAGIKKTKKVSALEDIEDSLLEEFFRFLDNAWSILTEFADEAFEKINPFSNWISDKPKKQKLKPPPRAEHPPLFIREAFKPKRSPHLWKSDPKPWWHLAFGDEMNNKVVDNLIKYQNDTITADA